MYIQLRPRKGLKFADSNTIKCIFCRCVYSFEQFTQEGLLFETLVVSIVLIAVISPLDITRVGLANNSTFAALLAFIRCAANQWQVKCLLTRTNGRDLPTDEMQFFRHKYSDEGIIERVSEGVQKHAAKEQPPARWLAGWLQQCAQTTSFAPTS